MSSDPAHTILGFTPESERTSLGPAAVSAPDISGAYFYPGYKSDLTKYTFLEASYKGGPSFKEGYDRAGKAIFIRHEREAETRYQRRRSMTTYRNYVGPIVDQYAAYVGSSKAVRSKQKAFVEWAKNCDTAGTTLQDFMTHCGTKGLLLGRWWVGVDMPRAPDGARTAADDEGRKPYLMHVHPSNVVDFALDALGRVTRLVIHHEKYVKASFGSPGEIHHEFHEWTAESMTVYRARPAQPQAVQTGSGQQMDKATPSYRVEAGSPVKHGYGRVPFATLEILEGKGLAEDIAESNKTVLNLQGLLYEELYNCTFSQVWISGAEDDEKENMKAGTSTMWFLANPEAKVHTAGANAEQAQSIMNALFMEVKEIHRQAHLEQSGEPLQKRVAEAASKLEKSHESMDQILEHAADRLQRLENELLEIAASFNTAHVKAGDAITIWPKVFDTKSLREKIALAIELDQVPFLPRAAKKGLARQITEEILESGEDASDADREIKDAQHSRSAAEVQIAKLLFDAGASGPVQLYVQFVDPHATPEQARTELEKISTDREKFSPAAQEEGSTDPSKKPPNRPEKQPTPEETRKADEKQQAANQT